MWNKCTYSWARRGIYKQDTDRVGYYYFCLLLTTYYFLGQIEIKRYWQNYYTVDIINCWSTHDYIPKQKQNKNSLSSSSLFHPFHHQQQKHYKSLQKQQRRENLFSSFSSFAGSFQFSNHFPLHSISTSPKRTAPPLLLPQLHRQVKQNLVCGIARMHACKNIK